MTLRPEMLEKRLQRAWPRLFQSLPALREHAIKLPRDAFGTHEPALLGAVIVRGHEIAAEVEPLLDLVERGIESLAADAERRSLSFAELDIIDVMGVLASVGVSVREDTRRQAAAALPAIRTNRHHERAHYYWHHAITALALDVPAVYRGATGVEKGQAIPFRPGATFEFNLQGFLAHLAGAVEQRAPLATCLPAWEELLRHYGELRAAWNVDEGMLLWAAWVLQHRIAGEPIATVGDFLHDSVYRVASP